MKRLLSFLVLLTLLSGQAGAVLVECACPSKMACHCKNRSGCCANRETPHPSSLRSQPSPTRGEGVYGHRRGEGVRRCAKISAKSAPDSILAQAVSIDVFAPVNVLEGVCIVVERISSAPTLRIRQPRIRTPDLSTETLRAPPVV